MFVVCLKFYGTASILKFVIFLGAQALCACLFRFSSLSFLNAIFENWFFNCFSLNHDVKVHFLPVSLDPKNSYNPFPPFPFIFLLLFDSIDFFDFLFLLF